MLKYKVLTEGCTPIRARYEDAGLDLISAESVLIYPHHAVKVPPGVAVKIPDGMYGMLTHRSSLAFKKNCILSLGVIDSNFVQEIHAKVFNLSPYYSTEIKKGDRIAQLILHEYKSLEMEAVEDLGIGKGGFGSSGVREVTWKRS